MEPKAPILGLRRAPAAAPHFSQEAIEAVLFPATRARLLQPRRPAGDGLHRFVECLIDTNMARADSKDAVPPVSSSPARRPPQLGSRLRDHSIKSSFGGPNRSRCALKEPMCRPGGR